MRKLKLLITTILLCSFHAGEAQVGLGGFNAVMTIPTARTLQDGHIAVGFGYIPKPYALYEGAEHDNLAYFATFGFLPSVEISLRATRAYDSRHPSIGDRMASIRIQILTENHGRPALAIGFHDVIALLEREEGANNWFTASYLVATKKTNLSKRINVDATIGYGVDWIKAGSYEFDDLFGGISLGFCNILFLKGEHDARRFNLGLGVKLGEFFSTNLVLMNGNKTAFGANIKTSL